MSNTKEKINSVDLVVVKYRTVVGALDQRRVDGVHTFHLGGGSGRTPREIRITPKLDVESHVDVFDNLLDLE